MNRAPFEIGEWYHCYTRGVDKRRTFQSEGDYRRFLQALYLCNTESSIHRDNLRDSSHENIFKRLREKPLVAVAGYCIMPNHYHLLLQETKEGGIAKFMQKVGTSYAMYFNIRYKRIGNLFVKPFRSKHIEDDSYLHRVIQYLHLNPAELFEKDWKQGNVKNIIRLTEKIEGYWYSSLPDYIGRSRAEHAILDDETLSVLGSDMPKLQTLVSEAAEYYNDLSLSLR